MMTSKPDYFWQLYSHVNQYLTLCLIHVQKFVRYLKVYFFLISLRFLLNLPDEYFEASHSRPSGWTNVVLNYIGPNDGQGIRMFIDGAEVSSDTTKSVGGYSAGDGRIVVGRFATDLDRDYASVMVDELIYFNAALTSTEVQLIYNSA